MPEDFNFQEGGVSPDGRYFVGENWPSMRPEIPILSVLELATGTQRHIGTNLLGGIFSPDGKQVVSVPLATKRPPNELALVNVETSERRSFYRNENLKSIWPMDWSPDGRSVLTQLLKKDGTWQIGLLSATEMCMSPSLTPVLGRLREHPQN
ncbi:MAG: hypothetical protein HYY23_14600 [Verrucomicrobia bacterium]|nr:hypothetical protein [Verrucomicrobiota bacterium]